MENLEYYQAENLMREGNKVSRKDWPEGKEAFYDVDGDGIPDELDKSDPDYLYNSQENYRRFKENIRVSDGSYINQTDFVANDWFLI